MLQWKLPRSGTAHTASWKFSIWLLCTSKRTASGRRKRCNLMAFLPVLIFNHFCNGKSQVDKSNCYGWVCWGPVWEPRTWFLSPVVFSSAVFEWHGTFMYLENGCTLEIPSQITLSEPKSGMCSAGFSKLDIMAIFHPFLETNVICVSPSLVVPFK